MRSIEQGIVAKFGGSSNATAENLRNTAEIVMGNPDRRYVVLSAPGKRFEKDKKITDLLLDINALYEGGLSYDESFENVKNRYEAFGRNLNCHSSVVGWLSEVEKGIKEGKGKDWTVSRGEWVIANIFARFAGGAFVDPEKLIKLHENGDVDSLSYDLIREQLTQNTVYVIPGFYGEHNGAVKIFARGGSDITGAIIARGVDARLYENWTDVDGVKAVDPRIIAEARTISELTYKEMRELGYRGADILQMDSVLHVIEPGIPINLKNSFNPDHPGTLILPKRVVQEREGIVGIAGRSGYISIGIEKFGMNKIKGIAGAILDIFEQHDVSFEHDPTGLDVMSVIFHKDQINGKQNDIITAIRDKIKPDDIVVTTDIGLVCLVGEGLRQNATSIHSAAYQALDKAGVQVTTESYSTRGNSIVIAVSNDDVEKAIKTLYDGLIR